MEMGLALARLLWEYDLRLDAGAEGNWPRKVEGRGDGVYGQYRREEYQTQDWFTVWKEGPMMQFRRRSDL